MVEPTLRGLRFTAHPKNPTELHGTVVPWLQVRLFEHQGGATAFFFQSSGEWLRSGKRKVHRPLPMSDAPLVRRALQRAQRQAISGSAFDLTEIDDERRGRRLSAAIMLVVSCALCVYLGYQVWAATGSWSKFTA